MPLPSLHIPRYRHRPRGTVTALAALLVLCSCGDDSSLAPVSTPPPSTGSGSAVATSASPETTASVTTTSAGTAPATTATPATPPATSAPSPTESTTQPQGPITVDAYQVRSDEAVGGQFQVQVTNTGDEEFTVVGVRLQSPGSNSSSSSHDRRCSASGSAPTSPPNTGPSSATSTWPPSGAGLQIQRPDGRDEEIDLPFQSLYVLDRIHRRECAAQAFAEAVDMHLGPMEVATSGDRSVMSTTLVLERRGSDEAIVVDDTRGSVLITPILTSSTGRELAVGAEQVDMPYEFETRSCMPHLLADVKKPFDFTVYVRIGDAEQQAVALETSQAERDQLWDYVLDFCADQR